MSRAIALNVSLLAVVASVLSAQDQDGPKTTPLLKKGVLGIGVEPALYPVHVLFERPAVQEELKVSPSQLERWRQIVAEQDRDTRLPDMLKAMREEGRANPDPQAKEERTANFRVIQRSIRQEYEAKLARVLDSHQRDRLGEIQLQAEGPMAFTRPEIQERLNLDPIHGLAIQEMIPQWRQAAERASAVSVAVYPSGASPELRRRLLETKGVQEEIETRRKAIGEVRRKAMQMIGKNLTKGQRAKYEQMLGEPFDFEKVRLSLTRNPMPLEPAKTTSGEPSGDSSKRPQ